MSRQQVIRSVGAVVVVELHRVVQTDEKVVRRRLQCDAEQKGGVVVVADFSLVFGVLQESGIARQVQGEAIVAKVRGKCCNCSKQQKGETNVDGKRVFHFLF